MAFYDPNASGPFAGPLYMNAMGKSPIANGSGGALFGGPGGAAGNDFTTLSPEAADAVKKLSGGGVDWLKLLQASAPVLQALGSRNKAGQAMAGPALQAMPGNAGAGGGLIALMNRQPLMSSGAALPGLLG